MIGPFQRQYLASLGGVTPDQAEKLFPAHTEARELIAKLDTLYAATNDLMVHLGAYGEVDTTGPLADAVMRALHNLDGGTPRNAE